jgi:hypothetical protein
VLPAQFITEIEIKGMAMALCDDCCDELKEKINEEEAQ